MVAADAPRRSAQRVTQSADVSPDFGSQPVARASWAEPARVGHLLRTNHLKLNYRLNEPGASAVAAVELWCTEDGHTWYKRADLPPQERAHVIDVDGDGVYGFTLIPRGRAGLAPRPPQDGDTPQILVEVDQTKPLVQVLGTSWAGSADQPAFRISYQASDTNLAGHPVSLCYSEAESGPWHTIARGLASTGTYVWKLPPSVPDRLILQVQALDSAGNVGAAQMALMCTQGGIVPSTSVISVEDGTAGCDADTDTFPSTGRHHRR
jgi:hypothetical protein